ncbi:hypothetical protein HZB02_05250 [Candidatus Woesearchaeota archaeon]|nr:hypothetical protein [Candidatus Woesearchaeota archaeon]
MDQQQEIRALIKGFLVMRKYCVELQDMLLQRGVSQDDLQAIFKQLNDSTSNEEVEQFSMQEYAKY